MSCLFPKVKEQKLRRKYSIVICLQNPYEFAIRSIWYQPQ
uniref:Uncharacterized protein n=1 Tax=Utricularia reniformis TaxID=192314 RepID=A0A1Y0B149_9LAMI|nr:hypothetical protein AEK19_MT0950 [Utricularia reniformis]ART31175.1 hypothetical protein AEK19_MT0950 [Utricularia reniformis]